MHNRLSPLQGRDNMETKRNYTPRQIVIGKALQLIAMDFDDMVVNDDVLDHWEEMLSDIPDPIVLAAVKVTKMQSEFRPKVADVRRAALKLINPQTEIEPDQAWGMVLRAVREFGSGRSREALASLPPVVARVAQNLGWGEICKGDEDLQRAHFLKVFPSVQAREKEIGVLPPALQAHIRQAVDGGSLGHDVLSATKPASALPAYTPSTETRSSGYVPPKNVLPFRRKPQARSAEELRQQAELLKESATMSRESAEFKAMTEDERAEYLKQQAGQLASGGAA